MLKNLLVAPSAAFVITICSSAPLPASFIVVDQVNPDTGAKVSAYNSQLVWQQEITAGVTGRLVGVDFWPSVFDGPISWSVDFFVSSGPAWQTGTPDLQLTVFGMTDDNWHLIDMSSATLNFNAGETFVIGFRGRGTELGGVNGTFLTLGGSNGDVYSGGEVWLNGFPLNAASVSDIAFRTYMEVEDTTSAVPEPSSLALLGIGVLSVSGCGWRRRRRAAD